MAVEWVYRVAPREAACLLLCVMLSRRLVGAVDAPVYLPNASGVRYLMFLGCTKVAF